ncbi:MAG: hypothetical protein CFH01_00366 [Alphaproteobacteria bacterium MarineAlpha2_Bin1]|nr:MAG: hypothetical protein CFH01_00366 [Alphaproteobacteria bacterium MarineAlpha2_Bin1]
MKVLTKISPPNMINIWIYIVIISIIARFLVWTFAIFYPIPNETGLLISPILPNSGIDLNFYLSETIKYKNYLLSIYNYIFSSSLTYVTNDPNFSDVPISPGPIFPVILIISNFINYPWVLSFLYLLISSYLIYISIKWLNKKNIHWFWLLSFGGLPVPFWYMLNISPDLIFSLVVTLYIFVITDTRDTINKHIYYLLILCFLSILLKPNGISLFIFSSYFILFNYSFNRILLVFIIFTFIILSIGFIYFYGNYLISYILSSNEHRTFFGYYQKEYFIGIYDFLPKIVDQLFSIISLAIIKLIYFSGIRPTYGDTLNLFIIIRSSAGLIIFPGIIWLFIKANNNIRIFTIIFLIPIMLGLAQERYSIPIYPLLYYYGVLFYSNSFKSIYNIAKFN